MKTIGELSLFDFQCYSTIILGLCLLSRCLIEGEHLIGGCLMDVQPYKFINVSIHARLLVPHPLSIKKGFVKGEALCLLRKKLVKESFQLEKK